MLRRGLKRTIDSTSEPVSLSEAKAHLRIDFSDDDTYIGSLITAARNMAESYTNRAFFTQTWKLTLKDFPPFDIELKRGNVQSVVVTYYDGDENLQTWDSSEYRLSNNGDIATIEPITSYPSSISDRQEAAIVTYVAGWSDVSNIPQAIKQAILLIIGHLYENRQDVVVGSQVNTMPMASRYLLDPYVIRHYERC